MNKTLAHAIWILGLLQALLAIFAAATDMFSPQVLKMILLTSGAITGIIGYIKANPSPDSTVLPPPVVKLHWTSLVLAALLTVGMLGACKTAPTQTEQAGIAVAVDIAAGLAIQQGSPDPIVWKTRATNFKTIATTLQTVNNAGALSLATLAADLQPLIAKLGPADVLAANAFVAALTPFLQQQMQANPNVANAQATIGAFLQDVIAACTAYTG